MSLNRTMLAAAIAMTSSLCYASANENNREDTSHVRRVTGTKAIKRQSKNQKKAERRKGRK